MNKRKPIRGVLLDIEGVLVRDKGYHPVAGAVAWVTALQDRGVPYCLVSNNTTHRPADLVAALVQAGFPVTEDHLISALDLGCRWLTERGRRRLMWLGNPDLADYWRELGFELVTDGPCEAVVLGVNTDISVAVLEQTLPALLDHGVDLVCLHRNPFFLDAAGERRLGPGAWAAALAAVGGPGRVITVGKPSEKIYTEALRRIGALKRIGVAADEVLFISDDPVNDLVTARSMGMTTAFVLSGKYADHAVLASLAEADWPHIISNSLGDIERPVPSAADAGPMKD